KNCRFNMGHRTSTFIRKSFLFELSGLENTQNDFSFGGVTLFLNAMGSLKRLFILPGQRYLPGLLLLLSFFCRHLLVSAQEPYRLELKYPDVSYNIYA